MKEEEQQFFFISPKIFHCVPLFQVNIAEYCTSLAMYGYVVKPRDFTARYLVLQLFCVGKL